MNKRIQEIAIQAGWDSHHAQFDTRVNKFVELIVRECILQMAINMDKFGDEQSNNPVWYKSEEAVMKHFGIK
jgi:hypothetical protein